MSDEFRRPFGAPTPPDRPQRGLLAKPATSRWSSGDHREPFANQAPRQPLSRRPHDTDAPTWSLDDAVTEVIPAADLQAPLSPRPSAAHPHVPSRPASRPAPPSRDQQKRLIERWKWRATALAGLAFAGFWLLAFGHPVGSAAQVPAAGNPQPANGDQPANGAPGASPYFGNNSNNNNGNGNGGVFGGFGLGGGGGQGSVFSGRSS